MDDRGVSQMKMARNWIPDAFSAVRCFTLWSSAQLDSVYILNEMAPISSRSWYKWGPRVIMVTAALAVLIILLKKVMDVLVILWWRPLVIRKIMEKQGIKGPAYHFLFGNMREIKEINLAAKKLETLDMLENHAGTLKRVVPFFSLWMKLYGKTFMYWFGPEPNLYIMDPELVKEVMSTNFQHYEKPTYVVQIMNALLGRGLVTAIKEDWANQRRIVRPAFHFEKLKDMMGDMAASAQELINNLETIIKDEGSYAEIEIKQHIKNVTADIIARTAFGSSYEQGKKVFQVQIKLNKMFEKVLHLLWIPGFFYIPTADNRKLWKLHKELEKSLQKIVQARLDIVQQEKGMSYGNDLLGLIVASSEDSNSPNKAHVRLTTKQLIDECKTFFFAGQETTECLLTWTLMLLALHPEWQDRAREEVEEVCQGMPLDASHLSRLKIMGMVLHETARLYPPVISVTRVACKDMQLRNIFVPKGLSIEIPIISIHMDPDLWGEDASEFKPERFAHGVASACKHPLGYMPFSMGPRKCLGQTYALMEAKVVLVAILQRFTFCLSSNYEHCPESGLLLYPRRGVQLLMDTL
ncbi:protein MpCYP814-like [Marchantia polymorpha subsp. ruderalis]|uniref:Cytochrome P450 n=3 Tax=Marchantia polymorpha TaxID=3197 RepID=A0AAF6BML6_MARPO|nr:hypothetical protein MARPO_0052s0003 [Marchantia polymorpha]BBN13250.1 hypothetical protein Mp_6g02020 [Marchantia polymorpha subsp. ruderalis]|eukprot:PTQ38196.1 hypothetical protein MARPO_0052s0003 [Marchantia polymorpha]